MKNKYQTGIYHLHLFDKHGTKQKTILCKSFVQADRRGLKLSRKPPYASYCVSRVLTNSLDRAYPWSSTEG